MFKGPITYVKYRNAYILDLYGVNSNCSVTICIEIYLDNYGR